jgi:hypothetical protein
MYIINFDQVSISEAWREDIAVVAADDLTPLDSVCDNISLTLQVWARSSRGYGDQSQRLGYWPIQIGNVINFNPSINATTGDGSGQLSLVNGVLSINIQQGTMAQLLSGYYQVGCTMTNADTTRQLFVGVLPLYDGGVFPQ